MFPKEEEFIFAQETETEISVWIEFLFQLTIGGRSFTNQSPELEQINEINHRVLNRIRDLRDGEKWSSVEDTFEMIGRHVSSAPTIVGSVSRALYIATTCDR